jgi:alpha-L-fucosidase
MGRWLKANGEAVYGTKPGPLQGLPWCRSTARPGKLYLHVFDWPAGGEVRIPRLEHGMPRAYLLADAAQTALPVSEEGDSLVVRGPAQAPDGVDTVIVLAGA